MRLENMQNELPKMPEEMRAMVEREVEKQLKTEQTAHFSRRRGRTKKTLIAALVAVMVLGTTVAAGAAYYLHSEPIGKYGITVKTESNEAGMTDVEGPETPLEILPVKMEVSYLPEGMTASESGEDYGKYCYADNMYQGGVSIVLYRMDTGDDKFAMSFAGVVSNEDIKVNGHDGAYLEFAKLYEDEISFNQRIYVAYTDVHYVMEMYVASDVTKEDAIHIAEGIRLIPVTDGLGAPNISGFSWSEYQASMKAAESVEDFSATLSISKAQMQNTHAVGDSFPVDTYSDTEKLTLRVADVQVLDNISVLDLSQMDADGQQELAGETDAAGNLLPAEINYIRFGDGINTVSEIVKTRQVPQKLVYVTVEYTNTGDSELTDVLFMGGLMKLAEDGDQMRFYTEEAGAGEEWDVAEVAGVCRHMEMYYYDVHGGERGNNYIAALKPGETAVVHMAWFVPEEELGYLYLNLSPAGGVYEFDDTSLAIGYVDIRQ